LSDDSRMSVVLGAMITLTFVVTWTISIRKIQYIKIKRMSNMGPTCAIKYIKNQRNCNQTLPYWIGDMTDYYNSILPYEFEDVKHQIMW